MSTDDRPPAQGHNQPPLDVDDVVEPLVELVAIDLWASRDETPWPEVGYFWRRRFRELATTAVESVRRHDRERE